jgi:hypothetical protein
MEEADQGGEEVDFSLPLRMKIEEEPILRGGRTVEFGVCYIDSHTRSVVFLGKVADRRKKERGNNLRVLLGKSIKDFSEKVENPSRIFLLGP